MLNDTVQTLYMYDLELEVIEKIETMKYTIELEIIFATKF